MNNQSAKGTMKNLRLGWMPVTILACALLFTFSCKKREEGCWECFSKPKEQCQGMDKCKWEAKISIDKVWSNNNTSSYQVTDNGRCMCEQDPIAVVEKGENRVAAMPFYSYSSVTGIVADKNNHVWLSHDQSTEFYNGTAWVGANITPFENIIDVAAPYFPANAPAVGYTVTAANTVYAATAAYGLASINANAGDNWTYYETMNSSIPTQKLNAVYAQTDNTIWIGTKEKGLMKFDLPDTWTTYNSTNSSMHSNNITSLAADLQGTIWFGNELGFGKIENGTVTEFMIGAVHAVSCDGEGNIWAATDDGLKKWNITTNTMEYYGTDNSGLNTSTVLSLSTDRNGKLWIGTSAGIYAYENGKIIKYTAANEYQVGMTIRSMSADQNNKIWVATENGVAVLTP
jgi:ligand-binding sensor domain-containing protein